MTTRTKNRFATLISLPSQPRRSASATFQRGTAFAAVLASLLLASGTALASPDYPGVVHDTLGLDCTPECTICHTDNLGGRGTVKRPFGETLKSLSPPVLGDDNDRLAEALLDLQAREAAMNDTGVDSDGDGMPDIEELTALRDPSVAGEGDMCQLDVRYGCGARVEPRAPLDWSGALAAGLCALGLGFVARRRWASR